MKKKQETVKPWISFIFKAEFHQVVRSHIQEIMLI